MSATLQLNGLDAISIRFLFSWRGVWIADVEYNSDTIPALPTSGPALLTVGTTIVKGALDPRGTGTFASRCTARVVGGGGGWDKPVAPKHFNDPSGALISSLVYSTTGILVGEVVTDPTPKSFGKDFGRSAGAASRVFGDNDWFVDPITGVTFVASWPSLPLDPTATIANYEASEKRVTIHSDSLVLPGTLITDSRFNTLTPLIARDVEQTFNAEGSTAEVWCAEQPTSRLAEMFTVAVREMAQTAYLESYRYRFVLPVGSKQLALQSISGKGPDLNPIDQWTGLSGAQAKILPGTEIIVGFAEKDPKQPYLISYSPLNTPTEIDLAGGANALVVAPWADLLAQALGAFATTAATSSTDPVLVTAAGNLTTALGLLPHSATLLTKAT